jgi:hypothetical protein
MTDKIVVPEGWKMDGEGRLVQVSKINPQLLEEDALVCNFMAQAIAINTAMVDLKTKLIKECESFVEKLVAEYGVKKLAKIKGNLDFYSFDRSFRISRRVHDTIKPNARIEAARQLFAQYRDIVASQSADVDAKEFINNALKPGRNDVLSTSKLLDLLDSNISHPLFKQAQRALREALDADGSCVYYNFYQRNSQDVYQLLSLRFSDLILTAEKADVEAEAQTESEVN